MMGFLNLFLGQVEIQFVDVVERHLVSISSKNYQLVIQHHWTMTVSCTWLLTNHQIWIIFQRGQKFWMSLLSEFCQSVRIRLSTRVPNHIKRILHCLRCCLQQNVSVFFLLFNFKILQHFRLFLVKDFLSLFINHFSRTACLLIVIHCWKSFRLRWVIV